MFYPKFCCCLNFTEIRKKNSNVLLLFLHFPTCVLIQTFSIICNNEMSEICFDYHVVVVTFVYIDGVVVFLFLISRCLLLFKAVILKALFLFVVVVILFHFVRLLISNSQKNRANALLYQTCFFGSIINFSFFVFLVLNVFSDSNVDYFCCCF